MNAAPRILVTGASGFIGSHIAAELVRRGADVIALSRNPRPAVDWDRARSAMEAWTGGESGVPGGRLEPVACDLSFPSAGERLAALLEEVTVVVHAAARLAGGDAEHARHTLGPTRLLCAALEKMTPAPLLVLVSSFSVYDHAKIRASAAVLDEGSPLEPDPVRRDAYTRAKLGQEEIARASAARGLPLRVMRPAYVYGPGRLACAHLGVRKGPLELAMGDGPIAAIPIGACAEALALAALAPPPVAPETFNVVDADAPDRARWRRALSARERPTLTMPVSSMALRAAAGVLSIAGRRGNRAPDLLRPAVYAARFQGAPVSDAALRTAFGWRPRHNLEEVAAMPA